MPSGEHGTGQRAPGRPDGRRASRCAWQGEGGRQGAQVSRMWIPRPGPIGGPRRTGRTTASRERDMRPETASERRPDSLYALELVKGAEMAVGVAVGDDSRGQRRPDARQGVQFLRRGAVDVHRTHLSRRTPGAWSRGPPWRRRIRACRRRRLRWVSGCGTPRSATGGDRRVHGSDLRGQVGATLRRVPRCHHGATAAHAESERGDRRHEQERTALGGSRHTPRCGCRAPSAHHRHAGIIAGAGATLSASRAGR